MNNYLECYLSDRRIAVWTDLALLGDEILIPPIYTQALAVAQAAMSEAAAATDEDAEALGLPAHSLAKAERQAALPALLRLLHTDSPSLLRFILATFVEGLISKESSYSKGELTPAYERLISLLKHNDQGVRLGATQLLGYLRQRQAVAELAAMLNDEDAIVRRWAVYGLEHLRDTDALITALDHYDREVRRAAIYGLGEIKAYQAVRPILSRLHDTPDDTELTTIAWALGWLGGRQVVVANLSTDEINELLPQLFAILERETATAETREQVLTLIGMIAGAKIVGALASELTSNNVSVRQSVIRGLVATDSDEAVAALQHIADSDTGERGLEARRALAEISRRRLYPSDW